MIDERLLANLDPEYCVLFFKTKNKQTINHKQTVKKKTSNVEITSEFNVFFGTNMATLFKSVVLLLLNDGLFEVEYISSKLNMSL